jgi:hypothetical protein
MLEASGEGVLASRCFGKYGRVQRWRFGMVRVLCIADRSSHLLGIAPFEGSGFLFLHSERSIASAQRRSVG